jgi:hypothetical protein
MAKKSIQSREKYFSLFQKVPLASPNQDTKTTDFVKLKSTDANEMSILHVMEAMECMRHCSVQGLYSWVGADSNFLTLNESLAVQKVSKAPKM